MPPTVADPGSAGSITDAIERTRLLFPNHVAIRWVDGEWTYNRLVEASARIDASLHRTARGAQRILLLARPGPLMIAMMLGTLRGGRCYVPVDVSSPPERIRAIAEDADVGAILADRASSPLATSAHIEKPLLMAEAEVSRRGGLDPAMPDAASPAYILYTSGTTGRPKGVIQRNSHVVGLMHIYSRSLSLTSDDRLTLLSSYAFDAAAMDIYGALFAGASLCILNPAELGLRGTSALAHAMGCTIWHSTPSLFRSTFGTRRQAAPSTLRAAVFGGEELKPADVALAKEILPDHCHVVNGFGPTECSLAAQYHLAPNAPYPRDRVPIGSPVEQTEIHLIDENGNQVDEGQIVVRSPFLALGYWQQDDLTRNRFRADPHAEGRREYFTGDFGRRLDDGALLFLGRQDDQIKHNGIRIELGEIEGVLLRHPAIAQAAVALRSNAQRDELVAFYASKDGEPLHSTDVQKFISAALPRYMLPSQFVFLESLPLTLNGKIDRRALSKLFAARAPNKPLTAAQPLTNGEQRIAAIWREVLNVRDVDCSAQFFEIGGDSLSALQMLLRIEEDFGTPVSIDAFFEDPSIRGLSSHLLGRSEVATFHPTVGTTDTRTFPLSIAQQRIWNREDFDPRRSSHNVSTVLKFSGSLQRPALERALEQLTLRHPILRTLFSSTPEPMHQASPHVRIDLRSLKCRQDENSGDGSAIAEIAAREASHAFDLTRDAPLRLLLLDPSPAEQLLCMTAHHLVCDGWSIALLQSELAMLYQAAASGGLLRLSELPAQYSDFVRWQRSPTFTNRLNSQAEYWRTLLADTSEGPVRIQQRSGGTVEAAVRRLVIGSHDRQLVLDMARRSKSTLFMVLLAALSVLLHRTYGSEDVVVGCSVAGRPRREFARTIGLFNNVLLLRIAVAGDCSLNQILQRTRRAVLDGISNQDVPLSDLIQTIPAVKRMSSVPHTHVMISLDNYLVDELEQTGVEVASWLKPPTHMRGAMFFDIANLSDRLGIDIKYRSDLFSTSEIEAVSSDYEHIVHEMVRQPDMRVGDLRCRS